MYGNGRRFDFGPTYNARYRWYIFLKRKMMVKRSNNDVDNYIR